MKFLDKFLQSNKKFYQACKSFIEEVQNNECDFGRIIGYHTTSEGRCVLIIVGKYNQVDGDIFLDKQLFEEKIFNFIKDCSYRYCFSDYLPTLKKELEKQFDIKDQVFQEILRSILTIEYYEEGDCVWISIHSYELFDLLQKNNFKDKSMYNFLLEKFTALSSNIIKFFSKPEYYKDIIREEISRLKQEYETKKEEIEQIKKDLKLLEKV